MAEKQLKVVFLGAGAVGASVGAWVAEHYEPVYMLDRKEIGDALKQRGISHYLQGHQDERKTVKVKVIDDLAEAADVDVLLLAVKNYSLDAVCRLVKEKVGDRPIVVGMQNGLENQRILPQFFSKVIYCVIGYNAWLDEPGVVGYQKRGPLHIGTLHGELQAELPAVAAILNRGVPTEIEDRISDAAHCKLVINLTNSLTTLIGLGFREIAERGLFQTIIGSLLWEGVEIVKAAGVKEVKLGGMPPWLLLWSSVKLPQFITRPLFEKNVKKMVISSMGQDILQRRSGDSELETINGYIVQLAEKHGHPAPFNKAIYELCKVEFAKPDFQPLDIKDVWAFIAPRL